MPQLVPNSSRQAVTVDTPAASLLQGPKKKIENRKSTQRFPAAAVSISMASAENLSTGWGRAVGCSAPPGAASGDHPFPQAAMPPCRFTPWAKHTPPDRQQGQPARHACCLARMARVAARNPCLVGPTISRLLGHGAALVLPHVLRKTQFHPESKQKKSIRIMITVTQTISIRNFIKQCTSLPCQHETSWVLLLNGILQETKWAIFFLFRTHCFLTTQPFEEQLARATESNQAQPSTQCLPKCWHMLLFILYVIYRGE